MFRLAGRDGSVHARRWFAGTVASMMLWLLGASVVGAQTNAAEDDVVPDHVAAIYEYAASTAACPMDWSLLGAVGAVASDHGRAGPETRLDEAGTTEPTISYEPTGDGPIALVWPDTDGGALDGLADRDETIGPFQFLPVTWSRYAVDGNGDGALDPDNLWDASASAASFLCDVGVSSDRTAALTRYFGSGVDLPLIDRHQATLQSWAQEREISEAGDADAPVPQTVGVVDDQDQAAADSAAPLPLGDWDGDGRDSAYELVADGDQVTVQLFDEAGRPYGRRGDLTAAIATELESRSDEVALTPVVGDWLGSGIDQVGLLVRDESSATVVQLDRTNLPMTWLDLGAVDADVALSVIDVPPPAVAGEFWKIVEIHDGTEVELWRVNDIAVAASLSDPLSRLLAAAAEDGIVLQGWGWRSHAAQIQLRRAHCADVYLTPADQCSPPTAPPGLSLHEQGLAVDFHDGTDAIDAGSPEFEWLAEHAGDYGLINLPSEPWHWSTTGG